MCSHHCIRVIYVTKHLQSAAKDLHGITAAKSLTMFSHHYIRVGVYALMDGVDENQYYIKKRLRWKYDMYMEYLYDATRLATSHNDVITKMIAISIAS